METARYTRVAQASFVWNTALNLPTSRALMFVTPPSRKNTAKARISTTLVPPPPLPGRSAALGSTFVATLGANAMSLSQPCFLAIPRPVLSFCGGRARQILADGLDIRIQQRRSEEHTSELQSLMRISYAVFCLKKKKTDN